MQACRTLPCWRLACQKPIAPFLARSIGSHSRIAFQRPFRAFENPVSASRRLREWTRPISFFKSHLQNLVDRADGNPSDLQAQAALFNYLLLKNDNASLAQVVDRYERQTGLFTDTSSPLLQDPNLWETYIKALTNVQVDPILGTAADRVASAVRKRDQLLPLSAPSSPATTSTESSTPPELTSEQLASAVLSRGGSQNARVVGNAAASPSTNAAPATPAAAASAAGKSEPIRVIVEEARGNLFLRAVRFLLVVSIYTFISLTILSLVLDGSGLMRASTSKSPTQFQPSTNNGKIVTFADVHGCEEAKAELQEVVDFLKDPSKFSELGGKLPKGVLLTGPPGTGKTLLARAVAGEAGVSFLFASGSEFDELYVGVGAKRVRELFAAARKAAPCIIFIDELDAIGSKRSPRDAQHMRQTLNQLLTELDGFVQTEGVILLGATNLPNLLDKALTRPGRFDRHVPVPLPDVRGRLQILQHHIKATKVSPGVDMIQVARGTVGFSGADLENLVNQAAVKASREGSALVTLQHIEWAKDKILMGAERLSAVITPESRRKTAFHEAGHALVALYTAGAMPLHRVTVIPRGHSLGHTMQLPEMDRDSESFLELRARLDVAMGGRVAEEVVYGRENITSGAASDIKGATDVANAMVRNYGFSDLGSVDLSEEDKLSTQTMHAIENEVRALIDGAQLRAMQLLQNKADELRRLAEALITYETLSLDDVQRVVKGEELQRSIV